MRPTGRAERSRRSLITVGWRVCLTLLAVALSHFSLPGGPYPVLALVSLVPLGLALHGASPLEAFGYAYLCALLGWIGSTSGLAIALSSYVHVSRAAAAGILVLLCAYLALPYGMFGLLYGAGQWMNRRAGAIKTAACLTLLVCLFPTLLPLNSSHAVYRFPLLIQTLDIGGEPFLLFALYLFNWLFVDLILRIRSGRAVKLTLVFISAIGIFVPAYGYLRLAEHHQQQAERAPHRAIRIAVIQPNIPLQGDSNPHSQDSMNPFHTLLEMSSQELSQGHSIDLVVWPETPTRISCEDESGTRPQLSAIVLQYHVPLLVNCIQRAPHGGDFNTELFVSVSGQISTYHKQILLPFAEYVPAETRFPFLRGLVPRASRYVPAIGTAVFPINQSVNVFPAICYEILFAPQVRKFIQQGGNVLVSPANDAWFGSSRIPDFVIAEAVYESVEYRIPVVRVSNSGNSIAVMASGEIVPDSKLPAFTKMSRVVEVFVPADRSPYFRLGNGFLFLLGTGWVLSLLWKSMRKQEN